MAELELTILMPCLDEESTVGECVRVARRWLAAARVLGEVVVVDNGSTDRSGEVARGCGARVVREARRGYGSALRAGIDAARGRFVIIGDSDGSYDFGDLDAMLAALRSGADLVIGNRFAGGIDRGAMPWMHRRIGNPFLSAIGRRRTRVPIGDFHCGLRGFDRGAAVSWGLRSDGMEFASEIIARAGAAGALVVEVPVRLHRDGRVAGAGSHLRPTRDGIRHLRLLAGPQRHEPTAPRMVDAPPDSLEQIPDRPEPVLG